jgi:flagellar protein FliS
MDAIAAYKENAVSTQTRGRLIVLLYEGAVKFLHQAIQALEAKDFASKGRYIAKAQAIITELDSCLDTEAGGEIAENLRKLYDFMNRHLDEANMQRDAQRIREVIACMEELLSGWKAITS